MILEIIEKSINFVVTVLAALKLKIAAYQGESFAFIRFPQKSKKYFSTVQKSQTVLSFIKFLIYVL